MWRMPEWTSVAPSGVSSAGIAGQSIATPLNRPGRKPSDSAACSLNPAHNRDNPRQRGQRGDGIGRGSGRSG